VLEDSNVQVLQKSPILYQESEVALRSVQTIQLKDPLTDVKEDQELVEICNLIAPNFNGKPKTGGSKYPSGGVRPEAELELKPKHKHVLPAEI
jgi:hypothetical protein